MVYLLAFVCAGVAFSGGWLYADERREYREAGFVCVIVGLLGFMATLVISQNP